ncbi:MAG: hypothetical protein U5L72_05215 [Bacteroidales bacterium]|nr:hypothetical protein [Bacteroidales bacterium]
MKRQFTSDYFVENGSFLKLDNVSAGYRFNNLFGAVGARVSFTRAECTDSDERIAGLIPRSAAA